MNARAALAGFALAALAPACSSSSDAPPISTGKGGVDASVADSGATEGGPADAALDAPASDAALDASADALADGSLDAAPPADANADATPPACALGNSGTGEGAACDTCATSACCDTWNVCYGNAVCVNLSNCIANCGRGAITAADAGDGVDAGTCRGNCIAATHATEAEVQAFDTALACVQNACGQGASPACD